MFASYVILPITYSFSPSKQQLPITYSFSPRKCTKEKGKEKLLWSNIEGSRLSSQVRSAFGLPGFVDRTRFVIITFTCDSHKVNMSSVRAKIVKTKKDKFEFQFSFSNWSSAKGRVATEGRSVTLMNSATVVGYPLKTKKGLTFVLRKNEAYPIWEDKDIEMARGATVAKSKDEEEENEMEIVKAEEGELYETSPGITLL